MNIFDVMDTYEIVNNGHGRYHFDRNTSKDDESRPRLDSIGFVFQAFKTRAEAKRLAKEEGLTDPF